MRTLDHWHDELLASLAATTAEMARIDAHHTRLIVECNAAGLPSRKIGPAAGVSRQTVLKRIADASD